LGEHKWNELFSVTSAVLDAVAKLSNAKFVLGPASGITTAILRSELPETRNVDIDSQGLTRTRETHESFIVNLTRNTLRKIAPPSPRGIANRIRILHFFLSCMNLNKGVTNVSVKSKQTRGCGDYGCVGREAVIETVSGIAQQCDGIRCDMAMLLLNNIFERTWGVNDYWKTVIPAIKLRHPEFKFIAEAYWDLEWELQQQGFDFCYDKKLYDRMEHGAPESVRQQSPTRTTPNTPETASFDDESLSFATITIGI
jgi:hypothetical protein